MDPQRALVPSGILFLLAAVVWAMLVTLGALTVRAAHGLPILPVRSGFARQVPWGLKTILMVIVTWFLVMSLVAAVYRSLVGLEGRELTFTDQMAVVSILNAVLLFVLPAIVLATSTASLKDLGLDFTHVGQDVRLGVIGFLAVTPVVLAINLLARLVFPVQEHPLQKMLLNETPDVWLVLFAYLSAAILAPLAEELMFRGIVQGWIGRFETDREAREPSGEVVGDPAWETEATVSEPEMRSQASRSPLAALLPCRSVVMASLLFSAVHFEQMPAPIPIFLLSLVLGSLYERTGRLLPSIVLHGLFNAFNTTVLVYVLSSR